ncbi:hypothetical protein L198_02172 [Cryptococcus wingfieldii CBS 7118]|uniref:Uncharacterized protein n=1 Tax=Cryptococcus wingfieldii CBS 7118 TaxID=1295528 RepID=A0A1E3JT92_9TREE|nr:hypothetical protein L198_02172 [Cryptococcus wingfieldii CBS 7118]ODO03327.1 hypothetical protein L198_02172 [Cryptococcus wingfieldii CBS 7118]
MPSRPPNSKPPPPLIVDVLNGDSSPPRAHLLDSKDIDDISMHRVSRASIDQDRPKVDPRIEGIPQGWEDDFSIGPAGPKTLQKTTVRGSGVQRESSILGGAFRDTRTKISSFSGLVKDGLRDRDGQMRSSAAQNRQRVESTRVQSRTEHTRSHNPSKSIHSQASSFSHPTKAPPSIPPSYSLTEYTDDSAELTNLFTPPTSAREPAYNPSIAGSTHSSAPSREQAIAPDKEALYGLAAPRSRDHLSPNAPEVLPFAADSPFSAWPGPIQDRTVVAGPTATSDMQDVHAGEASPALNRVDSATSGKRVWVNEKGKDVAQVYKVGWERDVLDIEGRLHETLYELMGGRHTFAEVEEEPKAVLDIGTGVGLWPISQARVWPGSTIVGLDIVPCQTNLSLLAQAEKNARSTSDGSAAGEGMWESIQRRVKWEQVDFLNDLPYDTGVFDFVHIRFVALGIPESRWGDVLEEAARVLKPNGKLEIVEMTYNLPSSAPPTIKNPFDGIMASQAISQVPIFPIQFSLPAIDILSAKGLADPAFSKTWKGSESPETLTDAVLTWAEGALGSETANRTKKARAALKKSILLDHLMKELGWYSKGRWRFDVKNGQEKCGMHEAGEEALEISVWAWVCTRR